jgi:imidazoleglycerol-phosphate dehydratase
MELTIETLKEIHKNNGYKQQEIAALSGYNRSYYNQVLNGKMPLNKGFLLRVNQALLLYEARQATVKREARQATVKRETRETNISLELNIDGSGQYEIKTGIQMFDHLLSQVAKHGRFDLKISATWDDQHHLVEDVAICLGRAFTEALGEKRGIVRMASAAVPMDDALAMVAVDIGGRGYTVLELPFTDVGREIAGLETDLIRHFLETLAIEARLNLHAKILYGVNDHHKAEALFKALGRALDTATTIDERISGELPSTKEFLEG